MKTRVLAFVVAAAGLAGCAANPSTPPGPQYEREMKEGRPGMFGDLTWSVDRSASRQASTMSAAEQEEFKKWRESAGNAERQEFEEWRAWQEWKRRNPK
jgi:Ni/Co efflux regulator RcnB